MDVTSALGVYDYASMAAVILISTLAGIYHVYTARKETDTSKFMAHTTQVGLFPLILSHVATHLSAISLLGFPTEIYRNGISFVMQGLAIVLSAPIGMFVFLPIIYKLNNASVFHYLELRFGKGLRTCMSLAFVIQEILICGIVIYAPSLALNQVTGVHLWASAGAIVGAAVIYTAFGGIKAVIWADAGQCVLMISVYLIIIFKGLVDVGGPSVVWSRLQAGERSQLFIWSSSPYSHYTFWTMAIGLTMQYIWINSFNQSFVQRYQSNTTLKRAQITFLGGTIGAGLFYALLAIGGSVMYANFYDCDPLLSGKVKKGDQMTVLFAVQVLSFCKGITGIFVGTIMCATLSTVSSMINAMTIVTLNDIVAVIKPNLNDKSTKNISMALVAFYGLLSLGAALLAQNLGGILLAALSIDGITGAGCFAVFTIGMLLPWVHSKGVLIGYVFSIVLPLWAFIGGRLYPLSSSEAPVSVEGCSNNFTIPFNFNVTATTTEPSLLHQFYGISNMWYTSWVLIVGITVSVVASKLIGFQNPTKVRSDLVFPFVRRYIKRKYPIATEENVTKMNELTAEAGKLLDNNQDETRINNAVL